jgi:hypothetical protein
MTERSAYPSEEEVHEARMEQLLLSMDGPMPGRVQSYDPVHQVADVVPQVRNPYPQPDGTYVFEDLPVIPDVPILWPRCGKWFMAMSVEPGDAVVIIPGGVAPDRWRREGVTDALTGVARAVRGVTNPGDMARFHIANAYAIPAGETYGGALRHAPPSHPPAHPAASLTVGSDDDAGTRISIYGDGSVKITQGSAVVVQIDADGTVHIGGAAGDFVALAGLVKGNFDALKAVFDGWTPAPNDGGAALKTLLGGWTVGEVKATKAKAT